MKLYIRKWTVLFYGEQIWNSSETVNVDEFRWYFLTDIVGNYAAESDLLVADQ